MNTKDRLPACSSASLLEIFIAFCKMTLVSFGGGLTAWSCQILVTEKKWLSNEEFLEALSLSQTLPGAINANIAIMVGRKLKGIPGALSALLGLVLPAIAVLAILLSLYTSFSSNPAVDKAFDGVTCACAGLSAATAFHLGKKHFKNPLGICFALTAFILVGIFRFSLVSVLLSCGPLSVLCVWFFARIKTRDGGAT